MTTLRDILTQLDSLRDTVRWLQRQRDQDREHVAALQAAVERLEEARRRHVGQVPVQPVWPLRSALQGNSADRERRDEWERLIAEVRVAGRRAR